MLKSSQENIIKKAGIDNFSFDNINATTIKGENALMIALKNGLYDTAKSLIICWIKLNTQDNMWKTHIMHLFDYLQNNQEEKDKIEAKKVIDLINKYLPINPELKDKNKKTNWEYLSEINNIIV